MRAVRIAAWAGATALTLALVLSWSRPRDGALAVVVPPDPGAGGLGIRDNPDRAELVLDYGPVDLPAQASHGAVEQLGPRVARIPLDGWLHGYRIEIVDAQGRAVPQRVLHHINLISASRRELFSAIMQRIGAAGHETDPVRLPRPLGYPVSAGDSIVVTAMLHNPTAEPYREVYVRTRMRYTRRGSWRPTLAVYPLYLDVMPPARKHAYDLPAGRSEKSWEGKPARSGRVLGLGGHLHRHAVALRLEDVTAGKLLWEARPTLDEDGDVVGMPSRLFLWRLGLPLRADHVYRLTAVYENPTGRTIPDGAMGALGGIMLKKRGEAWPALDREHADYLLDRQLLSDTSYGAESGGHHHD